MLKFVVFVCFVQHRRRHRRSVTDPDDPTENPKIQTLHDVTEHNVTGY